MTQEEIKAELKDLDKEKVKKIAIPKIGAGLDKLDWGIVLSILKEAFRHLLPNELFYAPKHGFAVPIGVWLETNLKEKLTYFAGKDFLEKQGLFNYQYINNMSHLKKYVLRQKIPHL